ncbi:TPA: hypothetical protein PT474_002084 [Staphylococcus aureus]|nr:hypothetical protein [Staphylococcus aureus]HDK7769768.1 hypothetical protein [Staphylococcus aureus]HDK7845899.1 hypothetical protein [Staphylococcus aureus]
MSEYKKQIKQLFDSDITGYKISKETGVSQYVISQVRLGKREIDNLTLKTTEKLYEYAKKVLQYYYFSGNQSRYTLNL